jgi:hypothetical protein
MWWMVQTIGYAPAKKCTLQSSGNTDLEPETATQFSLVNNDHPSLPPSPSLSPLPDPCEILLLPRTNEDSKKANRYLELELQLDTRNDSDVNSMNRTICKVSTNIFFSHPGTRTPRMTTDDQRKKYSTHNRELKHTRKVKVVAMRWLRQAQREQQSPDAARPLKGAYLKANRQYSKALKKSKRVGNERLGIRMRRECATSFCKFTSKILDSYNTADAEPTFSSETAEQYFAKTYSSSPCTFTQPDWLQTPAEPDQSFDCDPIWVSCSSSGPRLPLRQVLLTLPRTKF